MAEHKHAAVLRAIAEGKEVECFVEKHWSANVYCVNPLSHPHIEWRIKPEPKPDVVTYDYVRTPEHPTCCFTPDQARAQSCGQPILRVVWDGEDPTKLKSAEVLP